MNNIEYKMPDITKLILRIDPTQVLDDTMLAAEVQCSVKY